jgi:hypothetical protein
MQGRFFLYLAAGGAGKRLGQWGTRTGIWSLRCCMAYAQFFFGVPLGEVEGSLRLIHGDY